VFGRCPDCVKAAAVPLRTTPSKNLIDHSLVQTGQLWSESAIKISKTWLIIDILGMIMMAVPDKEFRLLFSFNT
jgi:hypothetical protein